MQALYKLMALSRKSSEEVQKEVQQLPCSYEYAADFYAAFGYFPTASECRHIDLRLISAYRNLLSVDKTKSTENITLPNGNINGKI